MTGDRGQQRRRQHGRGAATWPHATPALGQHRGPQPPQPPHDPSPPLLQKYRLSLAEGPDGGRGTKRRAGSDDGASSEGDPEWRAGEEASGSGGGGTQRQRRAHISTAHRSSGGRLGSGAASGLAVAAAAVSSIEAGYPAGARLRQQRQQQQQQLSGALRSAAYQPAAGNAGPGGPLAIPAFSAATSAAALETQVHTTMERHALLQHQLAAAAQLHQEVLARLEENAALLRALLARREQLAYASAGIWPGAHALATSAVPADPPLPALASAGLPACVTRSVDKDSTIAGTELAWPAAPAPTLPSLSSAAPALQLLRGQDELWPAVAPALQLQARGAAHLEPSASIALPLQQQQQQHGSAAPTQPAVAAPRPAAPSLSWDALLLDGAELDPDAGAPQPLWSNLDL